MSFVYLFLLTFKSNNNKLSLYFSSKSIRCQISINNGLLKLIRPSNYLPKKIFT